ncbi:MAG: hypothetical protein KKC71_00785 [Chloroflexi bacterium]|nr:hypothetical protein [Chloroflexota bacterium]
MSVLNRIAYFQERRDEVPNQELARELAESDNRVGIQEIAENLWNKDTNVSFDCIKVLYEVGYIKPELIAEYVSDFLKLMKNKHNRLVWGAMLALSTIAALRADEIYAQRDEIQKVMDKGSVITVDNGVKIMALVASHNKAYGREIFPYLLNHLRTCRPKDVPQHSEKIVVAVNAGNKSEFIAVLEKRMEDLQGAQLTRVKKVIKEAEKK